MKNFNTKNPYIGYMTDSHIASGCQNIGIGYHGFKLTSAISNSQSIKTQNNKQINKQIKREKFKPLLSENIQDIIIAFILSGGFVLSWCLIEFLLK